MKLFQTKYGCTHAWKKTRGKLKFWGSEKATKFEKKNLRRTFDKSVVSCARNNVLKVDQGFFFLNVDKLYSTNFNENLNLNPGNSNFTLPIRS